MFKQSVSLLAERNKAIEIFKVLSNASWITPFAQGRDLHFQCDLLGRVNINKNFLKHNLEKNKEIEGICTEQLSEILIFNSTLTRLNPETI